MKRAMIGFCLAAAATAQCFARARAGTHTHAVNHWGPLACMRAGTVWPVCILPTLPDPLRARVRGTNRSDNA